MEYRFRFGIHKGETPADVTNDYLLLTYHEAVKSIPAIRAELEKRGIDPDSQPEREIKIWQNNDRYVG